MSSDSDSVWVAWLAPCSTTTPSLPAASQPTADCLGTATSSSYGSRKSYISFSLLSLWFPRFPAQAATNPASHFCRNGTYTFIPFLSRRIEQVSRWPRHIRLDMASSSRANGEGSSQRTLGETMRAPSVNTPGIVVLDILPDDLDRKEVLDPSQDLWLSTSDG